MTEFTNSTNRSTVQVNTEVPKGSVPAGTDNQTIFESDGSPVTRTITDVDIDQVNITVGVPSLQRVKESGDVKGLALRYKIQIQYNGDSGFTNVPIEGSNDTVDNEGYLGDGNFQINGFTPDLYQRTHPIVLDTKTTNADGNIVNDTTKYPINIRVIRTSQSVRNPTAKRLVMISFGTTTFKLLLTKRAIPTALFSDIKFDAQQFPSIPEADLSHQGPKDPHPAQCNC